jgi:signal transduction histidine kinase
MRKAILALKCSHLGIIQEIIFNKSPQLEVQKGQKFVELFDQATYEKAQAFFLQAQKTDEESYSEYELYVPAGQNFLLLYFKSIAVEDYYLILAEQEESDYYGLFGSLTSINNELILTQKALNKKNKELIKVNELKNRLVGVAAHDLRNPISVIYSYSQLLLEDCQDSLDEEKLEFIADINSTAKFMLGLVEELLDLTYLESGKVSLNKELIDFYDLYAENIKWASTLGAKKSIQVTGYKAPKGLYVNIDKNKIQQVISNFISNAIKYSPTNSEIEIACIVNSTNLIFSCKDQGFGIDESELGLIFEPFKKARSSTLINEQSTGLGLAISKQIITAHEGKIWLVSQLDKGSTFYFSLPLESHS